MAEKSFPKSNRESKDHPRTWTEDARTLIAIVSARNRSIGMMVLES